MADNPPFAAEAERFPHTLTGRLRTLSAKMRVQGVLPFLVDDLDDLIEEVQLLDDERRRAAANAKGGSGTNILPMRPRRA